MLAVMKFVILRDEEISFHIDSVHRLQKLILRQCKYPL